MQKTILSFLIVLFMSVSAFAQTGPDDDVNYGPPQPLVIVSQDGEHNFMVEEAKTVDQQARGMMFRDSMGDDEGMIFEFEEPKVATIWMKNTAISLDILFVKEDGKILKIEHMAQPYTLRTASSEAVIAAVVELKGGISKSLGIEAGDTVKHTFFGNSAP